MASDEEALEQFKKDVSRFSGNYTQFLIIASTEGQFLWKTTDETWGIGAATRYLKIKAEHDRLDEQDHR